jgi:hypothetical protein
MPEANGVHSAGRPAAIQDIIPVFPMHKKKTPRPSGGQYGGWFLTIMFMLSVLIAET